MKLQTGLGVLGFCLLLIGCAPTRYSLREIREYDQAITLAEAQGIDTTAEHRKLVDMLISYMKNPGMDQSDRAMHRMATAQTLQAINSMPIMQPVYNPPPMTFNQWRGR